MEVEIHATRQTRGQIPGGGAEGRINIRDSFVFTRRKKTRKRVRADPVDVRPFREIVIFELLASLSQPDLIGPWCRAGVSRGG